MSTSVTISKTIQVSQFEPLTVSITRTLENDQDTPENRKKLYINTGNSVKALLDIELKRYKKEK